MTLPLAADPCPACGAAVWTEARFCHRCGAPLGSAAQADAVSPRPTPDTPRPMGESRVLVILPWLVAAVAVGALVALLVGQRLGMGRG